MYKLWLSNIEDKMGRRFREALENTVWMCGFVLSWAALIVSALLGLWYFMASFIESPVYILHFIVCLAFAVVSTFFIFLCTD